jgi:hypothetical protein
MALLISMYRSKLIQLSNLGIDLDFFDYSRIAGCNGLDLGVSESTALQIFRGAHRCFSTHHLMDEAGLGFEGLPHVSVEWSFGDVPEDLNLFIRIPLAQDSSFPLFDVAGPPRRVKMMKGYQKPLHVRARPHLLGRSQKYSDSTGDHSIEEKLLRDISLGVVDERDLCGRHSGLDQLGTDILIYVEPFRVRRRKVAENELSAGFLLAGFPHADYASYGALDFRLDLGLCVRIDPPHIECGLPPLSCYLQHVVNGRIESTIIRRLCRGAVFGVFGAQDRRGNDCSSRMTDPRWSRRMDTGDKYRAASEDPNLTPDYGL